jgi:hypothetical protein
VSAERIKAMGPLSATKVAQNLFIAKSTSAILIDIADVH